MRTIVFAVGVVVLPLLACAAPPLSFLRADGTRLVDEKTRQPLLLKGCNLGNWLMIELWMLGGVIDPKDAVDQVTIIQTFKSRFGEERGQALIDLYRANWIQPRDFDLIKRFGFNVVRVPFDYRIIQEDQPPYRIRPQAFRELDRALEMAEAAGVYVILDLHGTPGGNSREMHTGQAGQPGMWGKPEFYQRTADIWRAIADRYKDRAVVAAYDLVNEPYGNFRDDLRPELAKLMPQLYRAVREVDDRHIIYFSGPLSGGIEFYGDPKAQGMHDVGFTEHFYAGLFGDKPVLESHARVLNDRFPRKQAYVARLGVPYYVGEFNVVNRAVGGNRVMREYYDRMASFGWTATMWSHKLLKVDAGVKPDPWYMVTNATPLPRLNLQTSSYADFESFFHSLATMDLAVNESLRTALSEPKPAPLPLSELDPLPTTAPSGKPPAGWAITDIGDALPGGIETADDGSVTVYASGADIFHARDSFRFVWQPADSAKQTLTAQVLSLLNSHAYAKAGVMARWGHEPDAPFAMVNIFPDGTVCLCSRAARGAQADEIKLASAGTTPPVELRIEIDSGRARGWYRPAEGTWRQIGSSDVPTDGGFSVGLAVTSHDNSALTAAQFRLGEGPPPQRARPAHSESLLNDAPFDHWSSDGEWIRDAITARTASTQPSRIWRDVEVEPGKRYTFVVSAKRAKVAAAATAANPGTIELRLDGWLATQPVVLNSNTFRSTALSEAEPATPLSVTATAVNSKLRVWLIASPGVVPESPPPATISFQAPTLSRD